MFSHQLYNTDVIKISKETAEVHKLSEVLAWAADHNISYDMALKSLVAQDIPFIFRMFIYFVSPLFHTAMTRKNTDGYQRWRISGVKPFFRSAVESAVTDLQSGNSLSSVLQRHLRWWLPDYYIHCIELAEEKGCVPETLKQLARTTTKVRRRRKEIFSVLLYPFLIVILGFYLIWGMVIFIIPKFERIFYDLLAEEQLPELTLYVFGVAKFLLPENPVMLLFLFQIPWLIYYFFCTHRGDWILVRIPFLKRSVLRWQKLDAIQAMSVYSRMKVPSPEILEIICSQLPGSSLRKKLLRIRDRVINGQNFIECWKQEFPKDCISEFYLRNGYKTDKFSESLDQLSMILQDEDNRKHEIVMKVTEPVMLFLISLVLGIVVVSMFLPMTYLISLLSDQAQ